MAMHRNKISEVDTAFANDVKKGLTASNKFLSSKYFYNDKGSKLFQQIMELPEYYLTNAEAEILENQSKNILKSLKFTTEFNIVELGAGDGSKTVKMLKAFIADGAKFNYVPVDISELALIELKNNLSTQVPAELIKPVIGDYFEVLKQFKASSKPTLLLFMGANIGNYKNHEVTNLMQLYNEILKPGDALLLGVDLKKDAQTILNAYNDSKGITAQFNLNLLHRINDELDANFNIESFQFHAQYTESNGEIRSYLTSLTQQKVYINALNLTVDFKKDETIWTELSKKYDLAEIENLATTSSFKVSNHFTDNHNLFTDSLLIKK